MKNKDQVTPRGNGISEDIVASWQNTTFHFHNRFTTLLTQALYKSSLCSVNDYQMGGSGGSELDVLGEWEVIRTGKLATTNELS